jgi:hypothetical protein
MANSTLVGSIVFYGLFFGAGILATTACEDPVECYDDCESDDDCGSMVCGDNGCVPDDCQACWDNGRTCSVNNTDDACEYVSCT